MAGYTSPYSAFGGGQRASYPGLSGFGGTWANRSPWASLASGTPGSKPLEKPPVTGGPGAIRPKPGGGWAGDLPQPGGNGMWGGGWDRPLDYSYAGNEAGMDFTIKSHQPQNGGNGGSSGSGSGSGSGGGFSFPGYDPGPLPEFPGVTLPGVDTSGIEAALAAAKAKAERSAATAITNAGISADRTENDVLGRFGSRLGAAGNYLAGNNRFLNMTQAEQDAAGIRQQAERDSLSGTQSIAELKAQAAQRQAELQFQQQMAQYQAAIAERQRRMEYEMAKARAQAEYEQWQREQAWREAQAAEDKRRWDQTHPAGSGSGSGGSSSAVPVPPLRPPSPNNWPGLAPGGF